MWTRRGHRKAAVFPLPVLAIPIMSRPLRVTGIPWMEKSKCMFLYSMVPSPWDSSKRFTLHPLAHLFIQTTTQPLWEAFSHATITVQRLFVHIHPPLFIPRYSFTQPSELRQCRVTQISHVSQQQQEYAK